jgi:hypothetical protein
MGNQFTPSNFTKANDLFTMISETGLTFFFVICFWLQSEACLDFISNELGPGVYFTLDLEEARAYKRGEEIVLAVDWTHGGGRTNKKIVNRR